jgi:hypothetical protein
MPARRENEPEKARINQAAVAAAVEKARSVQNGHIDKANMAHSHEAKMDPSRTETAAEPSRTKTTRNGETCAAGSTCVFVPYEIPTVDQINAFWHQNFKKTPIAPAQSWYDNNRHRGWKTQGGRKIRDWRKALTAYVKAYKPPAPCPDGKEMWNWAQEEGIDEDIYNDWVKMGQKAGWKRKNPISGILEPIFDFKASLLAFVEVVDPYESRSA